MGVGKAWNWTGVPGTFYIMFKEGLTDEGIFEQRFEENVGTVQVTSGDAFPGRDVQMQDGWGKLREEENEKIGESTGGQFAQ